MARPPRTAREKFRRQHDRDVPPEIAAKGFAAVKLGATVPPPETPMKYAAWRAEPDPERRR